MPVNEALCNRFAYLYAFLKTRILEATVGRLHITLCRCKVALLALQDVSPFRLREQHLQFLVVILMACTSLIFQHYYGISNETTEAV